MLSIYYIGGVKVTNNVICKWKCHFGATYMDGMTGESPFYFLFQRGSDDDSLCKV